MRIHKFRNTEEFGAKAASIVVGEVVENPGLLLCMATGNSPLPLYARMARMAQEKTALFKEIRIIPLDEWIGLPGPEGTCHAYIQENIVSPLNISKSRYYKFDAHAQDLTQECSRIQQVLQHQGPIDVCILGLGKNGHLGFNEPAASLQAHCHIAQLSSSSQQHAMVQYAHISPTTGITLGIEDILNSKRIVLLVSGKGKEQAKKQLLSGKIDSYWPATFLWKHKNVDCLMLD